jgi:hypothetical protein
MIIFRAIKFENKATTLAINRKGVNSGNAIIGVDSA